MENHIDRKLPSAYKALGFNREGRNSISIMFNISIMLSTLVASQVYHLGGKTVTMFQVSEIVFLPGLLACNDTEFSMVASSTCWRSFLMEDFQHRQVRISYFMAALNFGDQRGAVISLSYITKAVFICKTYPNRPTINVQ